MEQSPPSEPEAPPKLSFGSALPAGFDYRSHVRVDKPDLEPVAQVPTSVSEVKPRLSTGALPAGFDYRTHKRPDLISQEEPG